MENQREKKGKLTSKVDIIIPYLNKELSERCISAILENSGVPQDQYTITSEFDSEKIGCPKMVKKLVDGSSNNLVMFLGEDTIPQKDFLKNALSAMEKLPDGWGLVSINDEVQDGNVFATHWLADKRLLPLIGGEFFCTEYEHNFCDSELSLRCRLIGRYIFAKDSVVEHNYYKPDFGVFNKDTDGRPTSARDMTDRSVFERRASRIIRESWKWKLDIPKILHLYWGKNKKLSFMKYMTVYSFNKFNPDWTIKIHYPKRTNFNESWYTPHQKSYHYVGEDCFSKLFDIPNVIGCEVDFDSDFTCAKDLPEVIRSDVYRLKLLSEEGGFWSDFDVLYIKPMGRASFNKHENKEVDAIIAYHYSSNRIGFLGGRPRSDGLYGRILDFYNHMKEKDLYETDGYQGFGRFLFDSYFIYSDQSKAEMKDRFGVDVLNMPVETVYPVLANRISLLYEKELDISKNTIGIHWYSGNRITSSFENTYEPQHIDGNKSNKIFSLMSSIYSDYPYKYSIVMSYIKRADQLYNTLKSYEYHYFSRSDYEIIIVEDTKNFKNEDEHTKLKNVISEFKNRFNITHITSNYENKYSPAPLLNEGVRCARGKYIVLTNPECFHEVDVLSGFDDSFLLNENLYLICSCKRIGGYPKRVDEFKNFEYSMLGWQHHSEENNSGLNFCSAISRHNYNLSGGFDENFARGIDYDDNDFRQTLFEMTIPIIYRDDLVVLHQRHTKADGNIRFDSDSELKQKNRKRYYRNRRKDFRLGIGIPHTEKTMNPYFFDSFVTMDKPDFVYMRPPFSGYFGMDEARNSLVTQAFDNGCSHLLMMDTDQTYQADTIPLLLRHNKPVVACLVHRRYPPFDPIMYEGEFGEYKHMPDEVCFSGELVRVDAVGCGCVLYDMEVFLKTKYPWFETHELENKKLVGEDIGFCKKLKDAGYKIYVDTSIKIEHITNMGVNRSFYELFKKVEGIKPLKGA